MSSTEGDTRSHFVTGAIEGPLTMIDSPWYRLQVTACIWNLWLPENRNAAAFEPHRSPKETADLVATFKMVS